MRFYIFALALISFPLYVFSNTGIPLKNHEKIVSEFSNEAKYSSFKTLSRTVDFPTQVIRMSNAIEGQDVTCQQVNDEINRVLVEKITSDKFSYNTVIICTFDPETRYAVSYSINSFFDASSDEAVNYLRDYLSEYNGYNLFGSALTIESAKGLIVSLRLSVGMRKNPNTPPFIEYRSDNSNLYFNNFYDMKSTLVSDIIENFLTNDPEKVLPFLDKWVYKHAGQLYKTILRDSNYALIHPEVIFLMDNGEQVFSSKVKLNYPNVCEQYENHRCLAVDDIGGEES